ncbi:efflux RND transporter permease subunit [Abyssisolibacter fermentans]|uniref:efflux RND transporter permease subunit n=1 Tax=Abyssisolibacter fermentans TaxID=1766203 RepID=UPI000835145B|nr:efflux RND transporter permease subunit [Abyssisolibacter fermentans]
MNNDPKNVLGKISNFFIEKFRVVYLIIAAIILLGIQSYFALPREEMPEIVLPYGIVTVNYAGAAPQEVESLITDKIEAQLKDIDGVGSITSTSSNGLVNITVEFDFECDINDKVNEMTNKISEIQNELPEDCSTPIIRGFESSDKPIMTLNISGDYDFITLKKVSEDIQSEIEKVAGVNEVTMVGGLEREIIIHVDISKLATYNISINQIKNAIVNSNINFPGGNIDLDDMHYTVRTVAQFNEIKEIEDTIISVQNDTPIYLKDIASVEDTYEDVTS